MSLKKLTSNDFEIIALENSSIKIPKCNIQFEQWTGTPVKETFGDKPIVSFDNQPMFAEIAILNLFLADGWKARWVQTYARGKKAPKFIASWKDDKYKNQDDVPFLNKKMMDLLSDIKSHNSNSYSGCWDILGWKNDQVIFAEAKRSKKDQMRFTQYQWLEAGLNYGLKSENFLIVEWDFIK